MGLTTFSGHMFHCGFINQATVQFHTYNPSGIIFYQINYDKGLPLMCRLHLWSWQPALLSQPRGEGGGPQLTCWGSPDHDLQHAGTTETVVTGLQPSEVAYNAGGSTQSNASSVTTIESSPDGVPFSNVTIINATSLAIVWSTPLVPNGIVTGYVVLQTNIPHQMDLMLCRCRILYCNGALAGVLPLTLISYNTTGLLPFTLYMYMSSSHARRHCTPVGTWCWASSVLQPACPDPPVHCDSNLLSMRRTALLGDPLILSRTLMTLSSAYLLIRLLNLTSPLAPRTPCASFSYNSPLC
ncbi:hypothetical protein EMCRGX_G007711 [Ephydatia muelleri]